MDRRLEFVDKMYDIITGISKTCRGCLRSNTTACKTCWCNEAVNLLKEINSPKVEIDMNEKNDLDEETQQVLAYVNANMGVSINMIAKSFPSVKYSSVQFIARKLTKAGKIRMSATCPRVYFRNDLDKAVIETITQTFMKTRKEKNGKG